ncbi:MAG: twin-arginine translocase TatA/TatE family subunit [Dehalogenimonas sp.]|uniref:Sec-independent protein translocase protein TatA n=1 Tax=Candidatus Dehalogenimonas loeffleri TaxID=3127115 RepID=A0ABZ2J3C1_9CHLR|nr:twin-arginine translocase TatA/TatE family subunit [Dehalogenimonas sp.]
MRIGPTEMIIVLVIVILVFGIGKLPELGKSLGSGLRSFKKAQEDITQEVSNVTATVEGKKTTEPATAAEAEPKKPAPPVAPPEDEE